jgi:hypothetical protein
VKFCSLTFSDCSTIVGNEIVPHEHLEITPAGELNEMAGRPNAD